MIMLTVMHHRNPKARELNLCEKNSDPKYGYPSISGVMAVFIQYITGPTFDYGNLLATKMNAERVKKTAVAALQGVRNSGEATL
jgi:hypothetical protein